MNELKHQFWTQSHLYFLFLFYPQNQMPARISQIVFVSKDGRTSFSYQRPTYYAKPLYAHQFSATKNVLFGISDLDQTFFYMDKELNIFPAKKYEANEVTIPSSCDPSYIIKIYMKNITLNKNS
ncbi:hypothetical protein RF11_10457 [Thelohanellus kitauei]|uniref:Uncharacterized protein n=1 Tax=Thelohanellus kitauei TaxID=669202 RepID=A0A0C2NMC3_THEKT|nr:hypothetical protein RF11_10457 [Thelohanellus kitauei]